MDTTLWTRLAHLTFYGQEDPPGDDTGSDDGSDGQDDDGDDGEDGDDGSGDGDGGDEDVTGLKNALAIERKKRRDERKRRMKAERDARAATEQREKGEETKESERLTKSLTAEQEKNRKLAARLLGNTRDAAILAEARRQGFIDPTDALTDEIRRDVVVDQDDADPSDIEVDEDSVKDAVKKLATKKKHLVGSGSNGDENGDEQPESGTRRRRGAGGKPKSQAERDAELMKQYSAL